MERRSILKWATGGLSGLFGVVLGIPGLSYLIDPRNRAAAAGEFKRVARLSELVEGIPKSVVVRDIRRDAWTLHPNDVLGRVWLIRRSAGEVEAYTTICPHLGGSINFDPGAQCFVCPLHGATFDIYCQRVSEEILGRANPAPRGMDWLALQKVQVPGEDDFYIEVRYQNFIQGRESRQPKV